MTQILLVRHGETDWNVEQRFQGHADPPLNERGREQARALAARLGNERIDAIYASPLRRSRETADMVAAAAGLEVREHEGLREVDVGEWQGLTRAEIEARYPEAYARWLAYDRGWEQGETYDEMGDRVLAALEEIAAAHPGGRALVVTHGGPVRAALARAAGISHTDARRTRRVIDNCGIARFVFERATLRSVDQEP